MRTAVLVLGYFTSVEMIGFVIVGDAQVACGGFFLG